jgi:predicted nucleic acid-binding protein
LIALEKIRLLKLLCEIYSEVIIPEAVAKEFGNISLKCIKLKKVESNLIGLLIAELNIGTGEAEAISLANQTGIKILIDDLKARKISTEMGLVVTGTIGFLLRAKKLNLIKSAYEKAEELKQIGFYISDKLLNDIKQRELSSLKQ